MKKQNKIESKQNNYVRIKVTISLMAIPPVTAIAYKLMSTLVRFESMTYFTLRSVCSDLSHLARFEDQASGQVLSLSQAGQALNGSPPRLLYK